MSVWEYVVGGLLLVVSIIIIAVVLLQEGRNANISGVISGAADSFFDKSKARSVDKLLARWTKYIAILFFLLTLAATVIMVINFNKG